MRRLTAAVEICRACNSSWFGQKKLHHGPSSSRPCASSSPASRAVVWCVIAFFVAAHVMYVMYVMWIADSEQLLSPSGCANTILLTQRQSVQHPGTASWTPVAYRCESETCPLLSRTTRVSTHSPHRLRHVDCASPPVARTPSFSSSQCTSCLGEMGKGGSLSVRQSLAIVMSEMIVPVLV